MANNSILNYLKVILQDDVGPDIVNYISSIKSEDDYAEFMENIVDKSNSNHINSYNAIKKIIFGDKITEQNTIQPSRAEQSHVSYSHGKKERKRFKDINTYQEKKKREGRHACDCMGQEHDFLNNCLECGRIHCTDEGEGPCLFCGNFVTARGSDSKALVQKTKSMRPKENKVFDDDKDYFKIHAKKTETGDSKQKMVISLDLATRKIIEGTKEDARLKEKLLHDSIEHLKKVEQVYKSLQKMSEAQSYHASQKSKKVNDELVDLLIQMRHKKPREKEDLGEEDSSMPIIDYGTRVLDEDLLANTDHGLCLSMHQPYASLLVAGVKKHEGRTWPTNHRGRLWIAAAAKQPEEEEVEAVENYYQDYYKDPGLKFPKEYPTGCLLGCVFVEDCLDQETYRKRFPNGEENNSPFIFICSNPIILPVFYPIAGKHKIYPLDKELHKCAKMALQHAKYV